MSEVPLYGRGDHVSPRIQILEGNVPFRDAHECAQNLGYATLPSFHVRALNQNRRIQCKDNKAWLSKYLRGARLVRMVPRQKLPPECGSY